MDNQTPTEFDLYDAAIARFRTRFGTKPLTNVPGYPHWHTWELEPCEPTSGT